MTLYIKQQMFNRLKAKSKCCNADIIAVMGIPLLRLVCSECRLILPLPLNIPTEVIDQIEDKNEIISNHHKRIKLLDNLRHYWYSKEFFTDKEFHTYLNKLLSSNNPFLQIKQILLTKKDYEFDSFIFEYRLSNDYCIICKAEIDFENKDNRGICWKCHHYLCKEHIPNPVNSFCKACIDVQLAKLKKEGHNDEKNK